jgi:hypothetical protein
LELAHLFNTTGKSGLTRLFPSDMKRCRRSRHLGEAKEAYELDKAFAQSFVQDYLKPRFDNSKSISEFISYMDVKEDEQNVLQTQLASSALKDFLKTTSTSIH